MYNCIYYDQVYSNTRVSTRVNTSQHKSTRINTSRTRVNRNQHESNMSQHKSKRVWYVSTRINTSLKQVYITKNRILMAKQNPNVTYRWCFLEKYVESSICLWFKFFSQIYFQFTFYKGIWFIKYRVIVTCNNYYATDSHFIKILWVQKEKAILNLKDKNSLKL